MPFLILKNISKYFLENATNITSLVRVSAKGGIFYEAIFVQFHSGKETNRTSQPWFPDNYSISVWLSGQERWWFAHKVTAAVLSEETSVKNACFLELRRKNWTSYRPWISTIWTVNTIWFRNSVWRSAIKRLQMLWTAYRKKKRNILQNDAQSSIIWKKLIPVTNTWIQVLFCITKICSFVNL